MCRQIGLKIAVLPGSDTWRAPRECPQACHCVLICAIQVQAAEPRDVCHQREAVGHLPNNVGTQEVQICGGGSAGFETPRQTASRWRATRRRRISGRRWWRGWRPPRCRWSTISCCCPPPGGGSEPPSASACAGSSWPTAPASTCRCDAWNHKTGSRAHHRDSRPVH